MNGASGIGSGSTALQNSLLGINQGLANLNRDSQVVANGITSSGGGNAVTGALVDAKQQELDVEASVAALSITDQTLGTLLDVTA
jgi:hypothetical protein